MFSHLAQRLIEAGAVDAYRTDEGRALHAFFAPFVDGGRMLAEDEAFSKRWSEIGGKQYVMPAATVEHDGVRACARLADTLAAAKRARLPAMF